MRFGGGGCGVELEVGDGGVDGFGGGAFAVVEGEAAGAVGDLGLECGGGGDDAGRAGGAVDGYADEVVGFGDCWGCGGDLDVVGLEEIG